MQQPGMSKKILPYAITLRIFQVIVFCGMSFLFLSCSRHGDDNPTKTLVSIAVTPATPSIALGTTSQFLARGTYSDNSTQDLTTSVTWNSSDVSVTFDPNTPGLATSTIVASGIIITAADPSTSKQGTATLTVTAATLVSIAVTPVTPSIAFGTTKQFMAMGTYTDNTTQNLTTSVTWNSSDTAVATISNAGGSKGLAASVTTGSTTISATDPATGIQDTTTLTVTAATLVSIAVTPDATVPKGSTRQFTAMGTYTDNTTQNLTTSVTWNSSDTSVATISNAGGSKGLATAVKNAGSTTIRATDTATNTQGTATLTATDATLVSIAVTPANSIVPCNTTKQFTAIGTYSDNTTADVTSTVTWSSSDASVTFDSTAGLATSTIAASGITITATDPASSISGSTSLEVLVLDSIDITSAGGGDSISVGSTLQFTAIGHYSNGATEDLTTSASWHSTSPVRATINNSGLATGLSIGSTSISAAAVGVQSNILPLTIEAP